MYQVGRSDALKSETMPKKNQSNTVTGTSKTAVDVLLAEDVNSLGQQGQIVRVKPGFARNFLLPQGLATVATEHNKRRVELHKQRVEKQHADHLLALKSLAHSISKYSVTLEAKANDEGQLYGSIGASDIAESLQGASFAVQASHIKLEGPLKQHGLYTVNVQLHESVTAELKVWVVPAAVG